MIRSDFSYHAPDGLAAALEVLTSTQATVLAGGTWVVPEMHLGQRDPAAVLDLRRLGLSGIAPDGDDVVVGAAATYATVAASPDVPELLREMARGITGGAQIRNQGTVGGSACYANPASDVPAVLVALHARAVVEGPAGRREIPAADFFAGAFTTVLAPDDLLTGLAVPAAPAGTVYGYEKLKLVAGSWPIVTAAAVVAGGGVQRLVLGGAAARPLEVAVDPGAEGPEIEAAVRAALTDPWSDALADGEYRRAVAGVIAKRAVAKARATRTEAS